MTVCSPKTNQLLVFSDDWGRHPSSCQHLVGQLLPELSATWVNTIGMRPPRLDLLTLRRGCGKLRDWWSTETSGTGEASPENLAVLNPRMWPWMSHRWDRALNARLLTRQLHDVSDGAVAVTTIPIVADLIGRLPVRRWVYYCVDDFSVWPGLSAAAMRTMERSLLEKVDCVVAASENLAAAIRPLHPDVSVLTHGVDCDFWADPTEEPPAEIASLSRPLALFWGVVDRRMDADWVLALADRLAAGTIVLAGPHQDPDPRLLSHPRIAAIGPVPFAQLPALARQASVLIMPYADLPVTRAMQPLKLKEYLATGVPVVAADLPAVQPWSDCLQMVVNEQDFVAATLQALQQSRAGLTERNQRLAARLADESWQAKAAHFRTRILTNE
ncbi:glycosyltransferase [Rosistilla oblonga]|uniref:glycosyltransferase n=1 Tax=Rosistilla oblonga TaxID=2527990 RepID=UPI003A9696C1